VVVGHQLGDDRAGGGAGAHQALGRLAEGSARAGRLSTQTDENAA
jgi:hypothetical protein